MSVYFVSGIDTGTGKTIVTGLLARALARRGTRVITQKFIQTGCEGISEDILKHREIMGVELLEEDKQGTTCPYLLTYPASPHLAAEMDGVSIDARKIEEATRRLEQTHHTVLLEGAGGLYTPVSRHYFTIDYIRERGYPLILVTSPRLGSINHTLLSLEACRRQGIRVACLVYNRYPDDGSPIVADSITFFKEYLAARLPSCGWIEIPFAGSGHYPDIPAEGILERFTGQP
ncbi:MAG: dethiobiotin synthase [Odoribacteraceae bacterium]|jgi:dethiobiotin synthetase|nr:dethiobiotin synthase [Odoribacteraceae bacterium]